MTFKKVTVVKNKMKDEIQNKFQNFIYSTNFEFRTGR